MIKELENFIHRNKVYSKCNQEEKDLIDSAIEASKRELQTTRKSFYDILQDNELLNRENKALEDDNYMKCNEIARLKKENKGLRTTVEHQREKLDKYFKNLVV